MVKVVSTVRDLRLVLETWRRREETIGFVPTRGALHSGHLAIIQQAQSLSTRVVVSVFQNPSSFGVRDDLDTLPYQIEDDERFLTDCGCDLLFTPSVESMFPRGVATTIDPGPLAKMLEGAIRPNYFIGVATVMTKLLMQVMPDYAFFGEKDYQQLRIVEQIVDDLHIPVSVIPVPPVRGEDMLALSGRNAYLSQSDRETAAILPQTMETALQDIRDGHDIAATLQAGKEQLEAAGFRVDYFELADARVLTPARDLKKPARLLVAAYLGKVRLIDNMPL